MASSFPTSALHHNGILGLHFLWQQFALMNVSNLIERINNNNNAATITTMLRLKQGQLNMCLTSPIFSNPHNYYRWYVNEGKGNFNVYLVLLAADMGITFHSDTFNQQDFTIKGKGTPILDLWQNSSIKFKPPTYIPDNHYPLFFAEQLIARDRQFMITWTQYKSLAGLNRQGKKAKWYSVLENCILHNPSLGPRSIKDTFKNTEIPKNRLIDLLQPPSNNGTFKEWICYQSDSSAGLHIGKIISKTKNRSLELQIIKIQIHTYNTED